MRARPTLVALLLLAALLPAAADVDFVASRDPRADVEARLGSKLELDQEGLVDYTMVYYAIKYGHARDQGGEDVGSMRWAVAAMTDAEYAHATEKAALLAASKAARACWKLGKYGEKALKALIVLGEDVAKDLDRYIQEKSIEYDARHGAEG